MSISSVDSSPLHVKHETDLNVAAEANRILFVLNKLVQRSKFVGALELIIKDSEEPLKEILDEATYDVVLSSVSKYLKSNTNLFSESSSPRGDGSDNDVPRLPSGYNVNRQTSNRTKKSIELDVSNASEDFQSEFYDEKYSDEFDSSLSNAVYLLESNEKVRELAKTLEKQVSPGIKYFIKSMNQFIERVAVLLSENSNQFKDREKYLRETFRKNEKAKEEIRRMEEEILVTKTDANVCLIGRNILINRHQNKIEKIKKSSTEAIEGIIHESEKEMVNIWKASKIQQEKLALDYNQASEKFASSLKDHLATEKVLRAKRAKVENQVLGWIQKFDIEIGEKQAEEEEIQALLDAEINEVNEIQQKLDEQEDEYDELMQEKALYEEEMLDRRLYQFVVQRSARMIQRTFRMYKIRKLAKRGSKRGKKGK